MFYEDVRLTGDVRVKIPFYKNEGLKREISRLVAKDTGEVAKSMATRWIAEKMDKLYKEKEKELSNDKQAQN